MRIAILSLALGAAAFAQVRPEWDNPAIVHVGTEKPHATMMAYPSAELARTADRANSPVVPAAQRDLEVPRVAAPVGAAARFLPPDYSDAAWGTMPVPASWQMHGFDIPIYTNIIYPFPQDASKAPAPPYEFNPVGSYRLHFTVPPDLEGPADPAALRWRRFGLLCLGQRPQDRLQRGQPHARRIRHHAAPEGRAATCWRWKSIASATAPTWKIRTCGA